MLHYKWDERETKSAATTKGPNFFFGIETLSSQSRTRSKATQNQILGNKEFLPLEMHAVKWDNRTKSRQGCWIHDPWRRLSLAITAMVWAASFPCLATQVIPQLSKKKVSHMVDIFNYSSNFLSLKVSSAGFLNAWIIGLKNGDYGQEKRHHEDQRPQQQA